MTTQQPLTDDAIERIARLMIGCELPEEEWNHAAHWATALWLLRHEPADLQTRMPALIRAYNESVGGENTDAAGYHETITQASLRAAADQLASHPKDAPLSTVAAALLAGPLGDPSWILQYWTRDELFSAQARREWVEPDVQPLPF